VTADPRAFPPPAAGGGKARASRELYVTEVVAVGPLVAEFTQAGVLVLFGQQAPEELHDFSVLHRPSVELEGPAVGDVVVIGDRELPVLAVGDVVAANLLQLGHLDLKSDGNVVPTMPGDVCVAQGSLPEVAVGQSIRIVRPTADAAEERTTS